MVELSTGKRMLRVKRLLPELGGPPRYSPHSGRGPDRIEHPPARLLSAQELIALARSARARAMGKVALT